MREENEEEIEVEVEVGNARAFYSDKGAEAFKKYLAKKGFVEERGFKGKSKEEAWRLCTNT